MSRITYVFELNSDEQDSLWINDRCPHCGEKIHDRNTTEDIATWVCYRCDTRFVAE